MMSALSRLIPDDHCLLETAMSLLVHWGQSWFETYPSEPTPLLNFTSFVFKQEQPELHHHL
jgi:hypothetical protein